MKTLLEIISFVNQKFENQTRDAGNGLVFPASIHSIQLMHKAWEYGVQNKNTLAGYVCHDILEDTNTTYDELVEVIGKDAADIVKEMTFDKSLQTKPDYLASFRYKTTTALVGKRIDRNINTWDFIITKPDYAKKILL